MRPFQAALLLVFLALCCLGLWWLSAGDGDSMRTAPPLALDDASAGVPASDVGELAAGETSAGANERDVAADERAPVGTAPDPRAASEDESEEERVLAGRVVDRAGEPVAGATLYFAGEGFGLPTSVEPDRLHRAGGNWAKQVRTAETDARGRYELADHRWKSARVVVRAPGFAPHRGELRRPPRGEDYPMITLVPSVILEGRVVDHLGRPVEGASVEPLPPQRAGLVIEFRSASASGESDAESGFATRTDASGAFRLDQVEPGPFRLRARHPDAPDAEATGATKDAGERVSGIEIRFEEGAAIRGRVVGLPAGRGAEGLRVVASSTDGGFLASRGVEREAAVSADGTFRLRGLPKGESFDLSLRSAGDEGFWDESLARPARATPGEGEVVLEWAGTVDFRIRVVDAVSGEPIERYDLRAGVWWLEPHTDEAGEVLEDHPNGVAVYRDVQIGDEDTFHLSVTADGHAPYRREDVPGAPGDVIDLGIVRLDPVPEVLVRVLDAESGEPVRGALVQLIVEREGGVAFGFRVEGRDADAPEARTDASGVARLSSRPGRAARFRVTHKNHAERIGPPVTLTARPDDEHVVRLERGGTVVVTVLDTGGEPLGGVDVEHRRLDDPTADPVGFRSRTQDRPTDASGRVSFAHLAAGPHGFRVAESGGARTFVRIGEGGDEDDWDRVHVTEGGEHELVLRAPPRASLEGVLTENGRPLAGATITVSPGDADESDVAEAAFLSAFARGGEGARTDAEGCFRIEGEEIGPARLSIRHPLRAMPAELEVDLEEGENEVRVDLEVSILRGRVVDDAGRPVEGASLTARRAGGRTGVRHELMVVSGGGMKISAGGAEDAAVRTDADGRFELRGVAPGVEVALDVASEDPFLADAERTADPLRGGEVREIDDVELRRAGSVLATVRSSSGSSLGRIEVRLEAVDPAEGTMSRSTTREGAGETRFDGLKPGAYRLVARDLEPNGNAESEPAAVTVEIGARARAELLLP